VGLGINITAMVSGALTILLGGGLIKAVLDYLRDRRRDQSAAKVTTFQQLQSWNEALQSRVTELETALDSERRRRRTREDELLEELAGERRMRVSLEDRVERLESALKDQKGIT
jgi:uncharacterized protein YlxW (UPF0749 family)